MRHQVFGRRLNRGHGHRLALRRNLMNALLEHERITTTEAKARAIRGEAERVITLAKRSLKRGEMATGFDPAAEKDDRLRIHLAWGLVQSRLNNTKMTRKVFEDLALRYMERPGGYTRILKVGPRKGDNAPMVILELVEE